MGIKTQRLVGQAHAVIEPGKSIAIWEFHQMTGHRRASSESNSLKYGYKVDRKT